MIPTDPSEKTTLVLNRSYQAFSFFTARATIRHMMNGRVVGVDAEGNQASWDGTDLDLREGSASSLNWSDMTVALYQDQPCLRSAPNPVTGEEKRWPIPTVVLCNHHFGYHNRKKGTVTSLRTLYNASKGVCQYCLEKIPYSAATKDHCYPKSLGGSNDSFNLVLACRSCNNLKGSIFPHYDINGDEVKPLPHRVGPIGILPQGVHLRSEWRPYLFLD